MRFVFVLLLVACGFAAPCYAEKRVALVVGNSAYTHVPALANPANDARLIAATLTELGFDLVGGTPALDLEKPAFDEILRKFADAMQGADVALFYYAGHGVQVRGSNFLIPTGANPTREADVDFMLVDAGLVLRQMEFAGTKLNIVLLDACRNNPFGGRNLRSMSRGLAQMHAPDGTLISYATQPGNVALDGLDGNSPYTKAVAATIRRPGLDIFQTFNLIGLEVKRVTRGEQQPWVSASPIAGSFHFANLPVTVAAVDAVAPSKGLSPSQPPISAPPASSSDGSFGIMPAAAVARMRSLTEQKKVSVPSFQIGRPDPRLSEQQRRFIGVWISKYGFNAKGREALVAITSVSPDGTAYGAYSWGPPNASMPAERRTPEGMMPIKGKIAGSRVDFPFRRGKLTLDLNADNSVTLWHKRGDGSTGATTGAPVWQLTAGQVSDAAAKPR